ncbi:MAPK/MAK/MRK overlapping kinase [Araneus ventricosus]|uniref:MAPK/MAK/MRK overlapping kinase n=2 Tax=Araneus ventricosus TaxID=182803 RepID=A0A4Y2MW14_ARAVE|nr:MAPK/MAK/MRK overlapping kinase [Araneus ventricosus]
MYELLKARKKPLPEFRVKSYIYQLLRSLDHIHRHGIFHRDVKPENLLIRDNLLKLADFGSCRGINTKRPYTEYISTRWYRPPECLLTSGYYSYKMDMWAAGCVFFEALTNLPLFPGSSEIDQLSKIHNVLGTPKSSIAAKLRRHKRLTGVDFNFQPYQGIGIAILAPGASSEALELLVSLCSYDEDERPSARQALKNAYFLDLRLAEKYQHSGRRSSRNTGKRTSSASKQSSPLSPRSGPVSRVDDDVSIPTTREQRCGVIAEFIISNI